MQKFNILKGMSIALFCLLFSPKSFSQTEIDSENFESGWGIWNSSGSDSTRKSGGTPNGTWSVNLQDNSSSSVITTNDLDISGYTLIDFTFDYEGKNMKNGDEFLVQFSNDGGVNYVTMATYAYGKDFNNNTPYTPKITISSKTFVLTTNSRFRIQCKADGNGNDVYIDNILIEGYTSPVIGLLGGSLPPAPCAPVINHDTDGFIERVQVNTIDNLSGLSAPVTGYTDFTATICTDLYYNVKHTITINSTNPSALDESYSVWIDYNHDGVFTSDERALAIAPSVTTSGIGSIIVPPTATAGLTRMRVAMKVFNTPSAPCGFDYGEIEDYAVNIITSPFPEINVQGNGNRICNNDNSPITIDGTDYGNVDEVSGSKDQTFTVQNFGSLDLNLSGITIGGTNPTDFMVTTDPTPSVLGLNSTTNFTITFNPSALGLRSATVSIANNDTDKDPYTFAIQGTGSFREINITGDGNPITNGDATPANIDDTEFGLVTTGSTLDHTFTIQNTGTGPLSLTGGTPLVDISGDAAFTILTQPSAATIAGGGDLTFVVRFAPTVVGTVSADISIENDDHDEGPYTFKIQGTGEPTYCDSYGGYDHLGHVARVQLNTIDNASGRGITRTGYSDYTGIFPPSSGISTELYYGTNYTLTVTATNPNNLNGWYVAWIDFNQNGDFNDPGEQLIGEFTQSTVPISISFTIPSSAKSGYTRMRVKKSLFNNYSSCFTEPASWAEVEDYTINIAPHPKINVQGNGNTITDKDTTPATIDDTDFGDVELGSGSLPHTFTIQNIGNPDLNLTGVGPSYITITGPEASDFNLSAFPTTPISTTSSTTFNITFNPTALGLRSATVTIASNDPDHNLDPYTFKIQGTGLVPLPEGPGGVTANLQLWLKGTDGLGYTDGDPVSLWEDQARGSNATVNTSGQEPTYRDNVAKNLNFNPVVEFDNDYSFHNADGDFSYDNTSTQFLEGTDGMYTQDIFVVMVPDDTIVEEFFGTMDIFCGDENPGVSEFDETGIGAGELSSRFSFPTIAYAVGTTSAGNGYGVAEVGSGNTYSNVGIINARNNPGATQQELYYNANNIGNTQNDIPDFSNVNNSRYWIGRSEGWEASANARIAEIITFSARKDDTDLTSERNKIQSYLAIKYGITLGVNGTSQDYVDSAGSVIWDQSANNGYNYDIAGIGRDIDSDLYQKQSSSVNNTSYGNGTEGILTMGLTDIYDTNNENITANSANTIGDKNFLMWGNDGFSFDYFSDEVIVDLSEGISGLTTNVTFGRMDRTWKVVETGDVSSVKISIPENAIQHFIGPGDHLMFISSSDVFDATTDYKVMEPDGNGNLEVDYDFDGTKYITFGYAPLVEVERSIYFDGTDDYVDMEDALDLNTTNFTISAWIKRDTGTKNVSILSKRDAANTEGYDLRINNSRRLEFVLNGGAANLTSSVAIPENKWHHVAVIYNSGNASLYIDGVADTSASSVPAPVATTQSFNIAAANNSTSFFQGNIDEVRVWDTALSVDQLRYIMNQEIEDNASFVNGKIIPKAISKNEVSSIPWSNLAGYYPMTFTYKNISDASGKGHRGAIKNLNTVDFQTAPLPYKTTASGPWGSNATWFNNNVQTLPNSLSIVDDATPIDWNIIETFSNVTIETYSDLGRERSALGLMVHAGELQISGNTAIGTGNGLTITHYLKLDGTIDLEGESQLIQTTGSTLDATSPGILERDQQGTGDTFTYNYWASPVGVSNAITNNNSYKLPDVLKDGASKINFITTGYDGTNTSPIGIADYWIWKFSNQPSDDYSSWQHVRSTGSLQPGEGFTMKGPGTGSILTPQNYVFNGKPNNGDINLTINAGNDYLIGNPYASAIDAEQFILDNGSTIAGTGAMTGTLYFWEHWGGGSHYIKEYQGGYGTYNLSGGTPSPTMGTNDPDVGTGGTPTKTPGRYIPVGQGFFVTAENTGTITFNNGQRVFQKEGGSSTFMRTAQKTTNGSKSTQLNQDQRMKLRIGFNSVNTIHRQLLLAIDSNCTDGVDWGYDGKLNEDLIDDIYWMIDNEKYNIQARDDIENKTVLPIGLHTDNDGINIISIDDLKNIPNEVNVYLHDLTLEIYHDLRTSNYEVFLPKGEYLDRFEITFDNNKTLSNPDHEITKVEVYYSNTIKSLILVNPTNKPMDSIEMYNILGQLVYKNNIKTNESYSELEINNLNTGAYIIKLKTENKNLTKKVVVE